MEDLKINKGVELMLRGRRNNEEPEKKGFQLIKIVSLFKRKFQFKIEFMWETLE
jgi:hypothetical protein